MIYFGNWSERLERLERRLLIVVVVLSAAPQPQTVARRSFVIQFWQLIETIVSGVNTDADWSGGTRQRAVTQTTSQEKDKN